LQALNGVGDVWDVFRSALLTMIPNTRRNLNKVKTGKRRSGVSIFDCHFRFVV
jgi:hypothetical protein